MAHVTHSEFANRPASQVSNATTEHMIRTQPLCSRPGQHEAARRTGRLPQPTTHNPRPTTRDPAPGSPPARRCVSTAPRSPNLKSARNPTTHLSDHNRTSPEQHNRLDISTLRHPLHGRIPRREATRCSHSLNDTSHARTATPGRATPHTQIHPSIFHRHARLSRRQERGAPAGLPACLLCDASERHGCQVQTNATRLNHANECRCLDEVYSMRYEL